MTTTLLQAQRAREPIAAERAEAKARMVAENCGPSQRKALETLVQASRTPRKGKRIRLILQAVETWVEPMQSLSACRRGCNHCCSLPSIMITSAEARLLSQATGRQPSDPGDKATAIQALVSDEGLAQARLHAQGVDYVDMPCPFLAGGQCTVYEHRPVVCRTHMNMDDDSLLCERVPGAPVEVPFLDTEQVQAASLVLQWDETIADIRDFFPSLPQPEAGQ